MDALKGKGVQLFKSEKNEGGGVKRFVSRDLLSNIIYYSSTRVKTFAGEDFRDLALF